MHHSIADGIALARVLFSMTDEQPDAGIEPERADGHSRRRLAGLVGPLNMGARLAGRAMHEGFELLTHPASNCSLTPRVSCRI